MDEEEKSEFNVTGDFIKSLKPKINWSMYLFFVFCIIIIIALLMVKDAVMQQQKAFTEDPCGFCDEHCHIIEFNKIVPELNNNLTYIKSIISDDDTAI